MRFNYSRGLFRLVVSAVFLYGVILSSPAQAACSPNTYTSPITPNGYFAQLVGTLSSALTCNLMLNTAATPTLRIVGYAGTVYQSTGSNNALTVHAYLPPGTLTAVDSFTIDGAAASGTSNIGVPDGAVRTVVANYTYQGAVYTATVTLTYAGTTNGTRTVTLSSATFTSTPLVPVASNVSATVAYNASATTVTLSATNTPTSVAVASAASHGTATASGTTITYTPTTGYIGSDSFTYTASNGSGTSNAATVTITVSAPTLTVTPSAGALTAGTVSTTYMQAWTASGGASPYTTAVTSGTLPGGLTLSSNTLSGTPTTAGNYSFTITTTDSSTGTAATQASAYTLTIAVATSTLTFSTPTAASVAMGGSLTNAATSTLSGGSYGTISYTSSATNVATVNPNTGVITPVAAGTATITATQAAVAGVNAQATQTYILTVSLALQATLTASASPSSIKITMGTSTLSTTGGSGTGAVTYALTSGSCTVSGSTLTAGTSAGTCVVTATKAADSTYAAATGTVTIAVTSRVSIAEAIDASVRGSVSAQALAAAQFADAQISNGVAHIQSLRQHFSVKENQVAIGLQARTWQQAAPVLDLLKAALRASTAPRRAAARDWKPALTVPATGRLRPSGPPLLSRVSFVPIHVAQAEFAPDPSEPPAGSNDSPASSGELINQRLLGKFPVGFWALGEIEFGSMSFAGGTNKFSTQGVTVGLDLQANEQIIVGLALGYGVGRIKVDSLGTNMTANQVSILMYGVYQPKKDWFVDALLGYGRLSFHNNRFSSAANTVFSADRQGETWSGSIGASNRFTVGELKVEPTVRVTRMATTLNPYAEGSNENALGYAGTSLENLAVSTGVLASSQEILLPGATLTPSVRLEVKYNAQRMMNQGIYYADTPGEATSISSSSAPLHVGSFGMGLTYAHDNGMRASMNWLGSLGSASYHSNAIYLDVIIPF